MTEKYLIYFSKISKSNGSHIKQYRTIDSKVGSIVATVYHSIVYIIEEGASQTTS